MKQIIFVSLLLFSSTTIAETYTLYLIRHAEKDLTTKVDPDLTKQGRETAEKLKQYFHQKSLSMIYSTDYKRTRHTAKPVADNLQLGITLYDPRKLPSFAKQLLSEQKDALIVGHSNTTPDLVRLVGGEAEAMSEEQYGELFIVTIDTAADQVNTQKINL